MVGVEDAENMRGHTKCCVPRDLKVSHNNRAGDIHASENRQIEKLYLLCLLLLGIYSRLWLYLWSWCYAHPSWTAQHHANTHTYIQIIPKLAFPSYESWISKKKSRLQLWLRCSSRFSPKNSPEPKKLRKQKK